MRGTMFFLVGFVALFSTTSARAADNYNFVFEYVREMGNNENLRADAEREQKEQSQSQFAGCIRSNTRFGLELQSEIGMLRGFTFKKPFDDLIRDITGFYEQKILLYQQMGDICSSLIAGPQPNVDYAKVAAEAPKITARLSFIDHSLFQATPFIFATLISETPDSHNQMSHLNITKAERDKLVHSIDSYFGKKLNKANQNYTVSAAWVLKEYLTTKGYKCSDEP